MRSSTQCSTFLCLGEVVLVPTWVWLLCSDLPKRTISGGKQRCQIQLKHAGLKMALGWLWLTLCLSVCLQVCSCQLSHPHPNYSFRDRHLLDSGSSLVQGVSAHLCAIPGQVLHHRCDCAGGSRAWRSPSGCYHLPGLFSQGLFVFSIIQLVSLNTYSQIMFFSLPW